jgi:cyclophilin family peptidyl-prolyl cis-trans isomerase/HEAT repeat protein
MNIFSRRGALPLIVFLLLLPAFAAAQKPAPKAAGLTTPVLVRIVKAEDERRWDAALEKLLQSPAPAVRKRAALATGRIGDEASVPALIGLLEKDADADVRAMAAFALGETESVKAADAVLKALLNINENVQVRARAIEAAGKIAAANAADKESAEKLGHGIVHVLEAEWQNPALNRDLVLLGITAVLHVRPEKGDAAVANFLKDADPRVRSDAENTLARLRAKNVNEQVRDLLRADSDPVVRANAARVLGAAEDKSAFDLLLGKALTDQDLRVRVSAIRSLAALKNEKAAGKLIERGNVLLGAYKKPGAVTPAEKNELLEIAATIGRLLQDSKDPAAMNFLIALRDADKAQSAETEIALSRLDRRKYIAAFAEKRTAPAAWQAMSAFAQGLGDIGTSKDEDLRAEAGSAFVSYLALIEKDIDPAHEKELMKALPDVISSLAALKPDNLSEIMRPMLTEDDVFVRAAVAGVLADQPSSKENVEALKTAFTRSLVSDKHYNDAQLAMMDALFKLDKKEAVGSLLVALSMPDYLVRKKAFELLRTPGLEKDFPGVPTMIESALKRKADQVQPYTGAFGTRLGQVLNTTADYTRAVSRKNGQVKAVVTTDKGAFTIELLPENAPLTVDNFVKLARANYFNGVAVHRVVPNFVMQDGDPRGDGNGGPGWSIRCEINMVEFDRGAVGMALSGKDTGGSQWFVDHSPQPHLDGGYTVFGNVNETGMKVVDMIAHGDKIVSIKIVEGNLPQRSQRTPRRKIKTST